MGRNTEDCYCPACRGKGVGQMGDDTCYSCKSERLEAKLAAEKKERIEEHIEAAELLHDKGAEIESLKAQLAAAEKAYAEGFVDADKYDSQQWHIDSLEVQLAAEREKVRELVDVLERLVSLKQHKNKYGKTFYYSTQRIVVWNDAAALLQKHGKGEE